MANSTNSSTLANAPTRWVTEFIKFDGPRCVEEAIQLNDQVEGCSIVSDDFIVEHDPMPGILLSIQRKYFCPGLILKSVKARDFYMDLLLKEFGRQGEYWDELTDRHRNSNRRDREEER